MNALTANNRLFDLSTPQDAEDKPRNPALLTWPATLPVEIALRTASPQALRDAYGISDAEWEALTAHPVFLADIRNAVEALKKDGMSFRKKAALQAEALLETSWRMIHDADVADTVRADLIKFTTRVAGLDASKEQAANNAPALNIQINL